MNIKVKAGCVTVAAFGMFLFGALTEAAAQTYGRGRNEQPKLVVQIVVGQLRSDFLPRYSSNFTTKGFRLFFNEGATCVNARYSYCLTQRASGLATIGTGAQPAQHGIVGDTWFDRVSDRIVGACYDPDVRELSGSANGNATSPRMLLAPTLSDAISAFSEDARVFSVAIEPAAAIMLGGRNPNAAYWWNSAAGEFTSSSYYMKKIPKWVEEFNGKRFVDSYTLREWKTLYPIRRYLALPNGTQETAVERQMLQETQEAERLKRKQGYAYLRTTPYADILLKDFINTLIIKEEMGMRESTDMLSIYLGSYNEIADKYGLESLAAEDALYRIDELLKQFVVFLQQQLGKDKILVVLTSDHGANFSPDRLKTLRMPHGTFNSKAALLLVRSYLKANYGNGDWLKTMHNGQVYLNRNYIEDHKRNIDQMHNRITDFIVQMSGVSYVLSSFVLDNNQFSQGVMRSIQQGYNAKRSGDITFTLLPGWSDDASHSMSHSSPWNSTACVPLYFYGWRVKQQTITSPIDITSIAPTLSTLLGTPLPEASVEPPIPLILSH